jgi:hypothetical protein
MWPTTLTVSLVGASCAYRTSALSAALFPLVLRSGAGSFPTYSTTTDPLTASIARSIVVPVIGLLPDGTGASAPVKRPVIATRITGESANDLPVRGSIMLGSGAGAPDRLTACSSVVSAASILGFGSPHAAATRRAIPVASATVTRSGCVVVGPVVVVEAVAPPDSGATKAAPHARASAIGRSRFFKDSPPYARPGGARGAVVCTLSHHDTRYRRSDFRDPSTVLRRRAVMAAFVLLWRLPARLQV